MSLGWEGYGLYWGIVEMLSESTDYVMELNCELVAFALHGDPGKIKDIIMNYNLFSINNSMFRSESLNRRMELKDKRVEKAKKGAKARWHSKDNILVSTGELRDSLPQAYIISCEGNGEKFVKVGMTKEYISRRYSGRIPYKYNVLKQFFSDDCLSVEIELNTLLQDYRYTPSLNFAGKKECYTMESLKLIDSFVSSFDIKKVHTVDVTQCLADATQVQSNAINKENNKEKKQINKESKTKDRAFALEFLSNYSMIGINEKTWEEWIDHKIAMKTKITERALQGNINKLKKVPDANKAIEEAIDRNWKDIVVHELPASNPQGKKGQQGKDYDIAWEHIMTRIRNPNAPLTDIEKAAVGKMGGIDGFKRMTERELSFRKQGLKADFIGHFENEKGKL
jgi:hypothetical protein